MICNYIHSKSAVPTAQMFLSVKIDTTWTELMDQNQKVEIPTHRSESEVRRRITLVTVMYL